MAPEPDLHQLPALISEWAHELGFSAAGVATLNLDDDLGHLQDWLQQGQHGSMAYMARDPELRAQPARLHLGTISVISARMNYLKQRPSDAAAQLRQSGSAYISRYALGRDYHKVLRARLRRLADRLAEHIGPHGYRAFTDSAPILERALARNARMGWIGKNTMLINRHAGSFFLLGEIYTDLPLPTPQQELAQNHCGSCTACLSACPTQAFVSPYRLDARRCISYLTIENRHGIPIELRPLIGNRIFGCDDCQLVCPWNRYSQISDIHDFEVRHQLDHARLIELFAWDEAEFLQRTEGMPLRRAGYRGWLRNLAVALGNAHSDPQITDALNARRDYPDEMVQEHILWALQQQQARLASNQQADSAAQLKHTTSEFDNADQQ